MSESQPPLALVVSTEALTWDAKRKTFRGKLSEIDPTFWLFHQAHYRGLGLRSAKTGKVLPFYVERSHGKAYTLRPTRMALETCPLLKGVRLCLTDDTMPQQRRQSRAAQLATERAAAARAAGDLVALRAYTASAEVLARNAACPGIE